MMMMMTFHNFAGYEFIFAFKQPDVTYVTSSLFSRSSQGYGQGQNDSCQSIFRSIDCKPPTGVVADVGTLMSP